MNRHFADGSALTLTLSPRRGNSYETTSKVQNACLSNPAPNGPLSPLNGEGRGEMGSWALGAPLSARVAFERGLE